MGPSRRVCDLAIEGCGDTTRVVHIVRDVMDISGSGRAGSRGVFVAPRFFCRVAGVLPLDERREPGA